MDSISPHNSNSQKKVAFIKSITEYNRNDKDIIINDQDLSLEVPLNNQIEPSQVLYLKPSEINIQKNDNKTDNNSSARDGALRRGQLFNQGNIGIPLKIFDSNEELQSIKDQLSSYHRYQQQQSSQLPQHIMQQRHSNPQLQAQQSQSMFYHSQRQITKKSSQIKLQQQDQVTINNSKHASKVKKQKTINNRISQRLIGKANFLWYIKNWLRFLQVVNKFILKLKQIIPFSRIYMLTELQLKTINDLSGFVDNKQYHQKQQIKDITRKWITTRSFCCFNFKQKIDNMKKKIKPLLVILIVIRQRIGTAFKKMFQTIPVIIPTNRILITWNIIIWVLSRVIYVSIPLIISFRQHYCQLNTQDRRIETNITPNDSGEQIRQLMQASFILFLIDIFIKMNSACYIRGNLEKDHLCIIKNYLKNNFLFDLISSISLVISFLQDFFETTNVLLLLFLIRFGYASNTVFKLKEFSIIHDKTSNFVIILIIFIKFLFFFHLMACLWHYIGVRELGYSSWIENFLGKQQIEPLQLYIYSLFQVMTLFSSISIQVSPQILPNFSQLLYTDTEKITILLILILVVLFTSYQIYQLILVYQSMNEGQELYLSRLKKVNKFLKIHKVEKNICNRAQKYLEYVSRQGIDEKQSTDQCLNTLSYFIKKDVIQSSYMTSLRRVPVLKNFFSKNPEFLEALSLKMHETILGPGEYVQMQQRVEIPSIYIIVKGEVDLCLETGYNKALDTFKNKVSFERLGTNSCFGLYEFFSQQYQSQLSARTVGVVQLQFVTIHDFLETIEDFQREREAFCYLRDCLVLNNGYDKIGLKCYSCGSGKHLVIDCPFLFWEKNKNRIMQHQVNDINKFLKQFKRKNMRQKFKTLRNLQMVHEKATIISSSEFEFKQEEIIENQAFLEQGLPSTIQQQQLQQQQQQTQLSQQQQEVQDHNVSISQQSIPPNANTEVAQLHNTISKINQYYQNAQCSISLNDQQIDDQRQQSQKDETEKINQQKVVINSESNIYCEQNDEEDPDQQQQQEEHKQPNSSSRSKFEKDDKSFQEKNSCYSRKNSNKNSCASLKSMKSAPSNKLQISMASLNNQSQIDEQVQMPQQSVTSANKERDNIFMQNISKKSLDNSEDHKNNGSIAHKQQSVTPTKNTTSLQKQIIRSKTHSAHQQQFQLNNTNEENNPEDQIKSANSNFLKQQQKLQVDELAQPQAYIFLDDQQPAIIYDDFQLQQQIQQQLQMYPTIKTPDAPRPKQFAIHYDTGNQQKFYYSESSNNSENSKIQSLQTQKLGKIIAPLSPLQLPSPMAKPESDSDPKSSWLGSSSNSNNNNNFNKNRKPSFGPHNYQQRSSVNIPNQVLGYEIAQKSQQQIQQVLVPQNVAILESYITLPQFNLYFPHNNAKNIIKKTNKSRPSILQTNSRGSKLI